MEYFTGRSMTQRKIFERKEFNFSSGIYHQYDRGHGELSEYWTARQSMLEETKKFFPDGARYLGNILVDSPIVSIHYQKYDSIQISLNDIRYLDFCWAIINLEKVRIPFKNWSFPVSLKFSGLKKCAIYWCNRNQKLLPLKTEKYLGKIDEFQEDEIQEVGEGYINLALDIYTTLWKGPRRNLIMHIVAENLSVEEGQHDALVELMDKKYSSLLDAFKTEVSNRICGDTGVIEKWIQKNRHLIGN